uniref:Cleavage and polyadenylation specificity factor subunit 1 n=1 Tax=Strigamia maritima TaxID=126957 RepID=T1J479_STRMM
MATSAVMYAVHKQLHPPTGVEHAIYCHFFNRREKNLVMAGSNQLRVFRLTHETDNNGRIKETNDSKSAKMKMECLQTYSLFGNIMSLRSVQLAGSSRDALLLSFRDARLSVVEYDPGTDDLKTLSLHYFEEDEMKDGRMQICQIPEIRVDPEGRCAVMMAYGNKIVVLPFRKETISEDGDTLYGSSGKSPVLASYTIHIKELEEKMDNIIDLQFLHGYYEPTLLFLYEPLKTWTGRIAVRQDTCAIAAISLNIQQRVHPVIWSVGNLPFDCIRVLVVPRPIGGVMVLSINAVLYLNQSIPPYGVSLNSIAEHSTAFPLKIQDNVKLSLDCSQATFIANDKLVLSLKGGELYVLTLFVDSMRSVRSFHFDKAAASVLTTCVCICDEGYLFLGSRLGNSLLLRYSEKNIDFNEVPKEIEAKKDDKTSAVSDEPTQEPTQKKRKLENLGDWMASNVASIEDPDELEVYGSETHTATRATSYSFEVCDSLLNIGPCGQMSAGEPAFLSEEFANSIDPDVELVITSGYSKNGALTVLQRSVRPQVVTTFELPGVVDMWTVVGLQQQPENVDDEDEAAEEPPLDNSHSFLILSRNDSSMILQTGQEINELDHSGFSTQAPTVFAGNIGNNKYIVQVSPMGVRLLEGVNQIQHIPLDVGSPIVHASVADPYLMIMSDEGQLILLTLRQDDYSTRLTVTKPQMSHQKFKILTMSVYKDISGLFTTRFEDASPTSKVQETRNQEVINSEAVSEERDPKTNINSMEFDDEEELLYGNCSARAFVNANDQQSSSKSEQARDNASNATEITPTYWLVVVRDNGILEIYSLDDFKLVYLVKNFPMGFKVLVDSVQATVAGTIDKQSEKHNDTLPVVKEILLVGLGHCKRRPILLARVDEDLFIYEAFPFYETLTENHLKLRFRKVGHPMIVRERKWYKSSRRKQDQQEKPQSCRLSYLRYFEDIASYSGVFICGFYPHWLFLTSRGELRVHPMGIDGSVVCFSPFHNVNCPKGFLYFNRQGELRICVLPTHLSYDAPWPVRKVPLRCTSHFVSYHVESKTYCVVTSTSEPCNRLVKLTGEDKEYEVVERDDRFIYPTMEKFSVQLFSPVSWEAIPNTKFDLEEWEHVTCLKNVSLVYEGARSGLKGYMSIGTNYNYGEDVTSRGRIIILDVIEVVPEPGQPLTKNRIKIIYSKEQKGPVTALCQVAGYLLSCIGQKIYVWQLKDDDLVGIAFIDTQVYIHTAVSIKNLILIADIHKSISLLRFQDDVRTLSLVSRDAKPMEVYAIDFFIDNNQIGFLVSDGERNLLMYMYQPEARESCGGQRLLRKADFHVGSNINSFFRIRGKLSDPSTDKTASTSLDGSLGYLLPISEKVYRRLLMLQNVLVTHLPHTAGLNPKAFRMYKSHRNYLMNPHKNMLDGELLWKYLNLSYAEKTEISKKIGTTTDQIIEDLMDVDRTTAHF